MTVAILRTTTKGLLRWSRKPFNGKPTSPSRIILRYGESGRMVKVPSTLTNCVDDSVNLNVGIAVPQLECHADGYKHDHHDSICNQQVLAFGVRLIC